MTRQAFVANWIETIILYFAGKLTAILTAIRSCDLLRSRPEKVMAQMLGIQQLFEDFLKVSAPGLK